MPEMQRIRERHRPSSCERDAVREAAWQAHLRELEKENRKRVAQAKKLHAAGVRRQKKLLRELGILDLSPEEVTKKRGLRGAISLAQ